MNIIIAGSCKINQFQIITFEKKIGNLNHFMMGLTQVEVYFTKNDEVVTATLKCNIDFEEKSKKVFLHADGSSKEEALTNALVKLTDKYCKLCKKYSVRKEETFYAKAG